MDWSDEIRSGIDYLGQYRCSKRATQEISKFGNQTGIVVDPFAYPKLKSLGWDLVPERHNKSVWTPRALEEGLGKFGSNIPSALTTRVDALEARASASRERSRRRGQRSQYSRADGARAKVLVPNSNPNGTFRTTSNPGQQSAVSLRRVCETGRATVSSDGSSADGQERRDPTWDPEVYARAVSATTRLAGNRTGRRPPLSTDEVVDRLLDPVKFAGAPFFSKNKDAIGAIKRRSAELYAGQRPFDPFTAGRRVMHGEDASKPRLVWMAAASTTVVSTAFSKPIYSELVGRKIFAFGKSTRRIGARIVGMQASKRYVYGLDFSAFDARVPARVIDDVFMILRDHLILSDQDAKTYRNMVSDFIHSRIILPDKSVWRVHRGIPSGSAFTTLAGSVANLLILNYVWIRLTGHGLKEADVMVQGDDSLVASNSRFSMEQLASVAAELGMVLSTVKSERSELGQSVRFIGHSWKAGVARRDEWEVVVRYAFPERFTPFLKRKGYSLYRGYSLAGDCVDAMFVFYSTIQHTAHDVEEIVTNAFIEAGVADVLKEISSLEVRRVLPGRLDLQRETMPDSEWEKFVGTLRLLHVGRVA